MAVNKKVLPHYVDNKKLYTYMIKYIDEYKTAKATAEATGTKFIAPRIPEYVGSCVLKIATKLSYKHNFISYTYKEEMIGDGIENCVAYMHNFNPEKSKNPFAYFTMIIYNAFLHRIAKEHKQTYVKYKVLENLEVTDDLMDFMENGDNDHGGRGGKTKSKFSSDYDERMGKFVTDYEGKLKNKVKPQKKKGIEFFLEDNTNDKGK